MRASIFLSMTLYRTLLVAALMVGTAFGGTRKTSPRPYYGGRKHTASHGGSYPMGNGSSHKNGHYSNQRTNNRYGRHKR